MKKFWIAIAACLSLSSLGDASACTGLLVGKKASTDGSVMISYAADSYSLYGELYRYPLLFGQQVRNCKSRSGTLENHWVKLHKSGRRMRSWET